MAQLRICAVGSQWSKCSRIVSRQYRLSGECHELPSSCDRYIHYSKVPTMHYQASLPRLPVPKLADSCSRYLKAVRPLVDDLQFQETEKHVAEFQRQGGNGEMLQDKLVASDTANKHTSFISGPWFDMYLEYRDPLVLNHNPFLVFKAIPELTNQVDVAANLVWSSVRYRQALFDGVLAPEVFHLNPEKSDVDWFKNIIRFVPSHFAWYCAYLMKAFPLDMSQYNSLFNSTRLPRVGKDELVSYKDSNTTKHAVVFCKGHTYKLKCITDEGDPIPVAQLKQGLQEIISDTRPPPTHPVGYLTTMKRDPWAKLREKMLPDNRESLEAIDSAVLVLCLDDKEPTTPVQVSRFMLYGDAANRWFDKSFSYIVSPSGLAALNFEHSWGDGVAIMGMVNAVYKENLTNPQVPAATETSPVDLVEKVDFNLPDRVKEAITQAKKDYEKVTGTLKVNLFQSEVFGKNLVKKCKVSPDAIMQLAFQIAYYRLFKCSPATYESCSTAAFKHGRTETIRPATMATQNCAKAFEKNNSASAEEMLEFIRKSSEYHFQLTKDAAMGQGFDRHFFALKALCKRDGIQEPLFEDPSYTKLNHIIFSTSTLSSDSVRLGGFAPVNPDCYGIGYNIFDEAVGCHITTYPNCDGARLVEELSKVFNDLHAVLTGKSFK